MKRSRIPSNRAASRHPVKCVDGPFADVVLWLDAQRTTFPLVVKGQSGQYIGGKWHAQVSQH
jgi:hypothetical protein